jgi:D-glycero-alpha-D-manno-heptose 1-phosphate guanylyltransferase
MIPKIPPPTEAIILAGGFGTRLRQAVPNVPKPMAPVANRPFLEYLMDYWLEKGIKHFALSVGYMAESIIQHFGSSYRWASISYVLEVEPLGTGGALALTIKSVEWKSRYALLLNGDTWMPINPASLIEAAANCPITIALTEVAQNDRYGGVEFGLNSYILRFGLPSDGGPALINTGCYLLDIPVVKRLMDPYPEKFSLENDFLAVMAERFLVRGDVQKGEFIDIGIAKDYDIFCKRYTDKAGE